MFSEKLEFIKIIRKNNLIGIFYIFLQIIALEVINERLVLVEMLKK